MGQKPVLYSSEEPQETLIFGSAPMRQKHAFARPGSGGLYPRGTAAPTFPETRYLKLE